MSLAVNPVKGNDNLF